MKSKFIFNKNSFDDFLHIPQKVQKAAISNLNEDKEAPELTTNVAMIQRISTLERKVYNLEQRMNQQDRTYQAN